jgi:hypothetical protein
VEDAGDDNEKEEEGKLDEEAANDDLLTGVHCA